MLSGSCRVEVVDPGCRGLGRPWRMLGRSSGSPVAGRGAAVGRQSAAGGGGTGCCCGSTGGAAAAAAAGTVEHFATKDAAAEWLRQYPVRGQQVLVKGSRGMALETLVELL